MLSTLLPLIGILILLAIVLIVGKNLTSSKKSKDKEPDTFPYQKEGALFSPAERSFLGVLDQAVSDQFRVMGKVRLADIIRVQSGVNGSAWQKAFNRIQSKHLDFVICNPKDLSIQSVVELDDQSHDRPRHQGRDEFVQKALRAAGVPVFRFSAKRSYSVPEIQSAIFKTAIDTQYWKISP